MTDKLWHTGASYLHGDITFGFWVYLCLLVTPDFSPSFSPVRVYQSPAYMKCTGKILQFVLMCMFVCLCAAELKALCVLIWIRPYYPNTDMAWPQSHSYTHTEELWEQGASFSPTFPILCTLYCSVCLYVSDVYSFSDSYGYIKSMSWSLLFPKSSRAWSLTIQRHTERDLERVWW